MIPPRLVPWRPRRRALNSADYARADAVLQIVGEKKSAPFDEIFQAASRRLSSKESDSPLVVTTPDGVLISRMQWPIKPVGGIALGVFEKHAKLREHFSPIFARSPRRIAIDIRADDADEIAPLSLYAAQVAAAVLPDSKTDKKKESPLVKEIILSPMSDNSRLAESAATAEANILARSLERIPPSELTPPQFLKIALKLARENNLTAEVFDSARLAKIGAGAFLAVGRGGGRPSCIVRISYTPAKKTKQSRVALVGKGVCFDTGGVNLKPARHMRGMGGDMAGAAVVLAATTAAAKLRLPIGVDAWLALTENLIGPAAYRPDDVVQALNGKTIEIIHTDAEGRMALADTLTLATRARPNLTATFATLTGTMNVALGERYSGIFSTDESALAQAMAASAASGERLCAFPIADDYVKEIKSEVADIKQCSEQGDADHIIAARFLREFIEGDSPWLHLDLAASRCKNGLGAIPTEITGFGAAWAISLLRQLALK